VTPAVATALVDVARLMRVARRPWWVIGSGAVALHGAPAGEVHDIDVLVDRVDIATVMASAGIDAQVMPSDPLFRSEVFASWQRSVLPVELMAGFAVFSGGDWWPVRPLSREAITLGGEMLFVPDRRELVGLLRRIGRPKDVRRAAALEGREPG